MRLNPYVLHGYFIYVCVVSEISNNNCFAKEVNICVGLCSPIALGLVIKTIKVEFLKTIGGRGVNILAGN